MFKYFLGIALIFIIVACEPGLYCPEGQVKPRGSDVCVENTCISHTCSASNQECVVTTSGPKCECIDSEATIVNGACVNNTIKDVNCSNHGSLKYSSGQHYCECETGYQNLPSNKLVCIPRVFNCANTTCADGEIITLFENKASNGVNFVIIGDGYQTRDLARNGKFAAHAKNSQMT